MADRRTRVGIVADLLEERWPSMDLVADMLMAHLTPDAASHLDVALLRPSLTPSLLTRVGRVARMDRYVRRFSDYPAWLRARAAQFDVFHVIDHSYAHVVHALPAERTIVTCHDADAFLPLVAPELTTSRLPLALVRRIHRGLRAARIVACPSAATRDELLQFRLVEPERVQVVWNGVHPELTPEANRDADAFVRSLLGEPDGHLDLLHVGTCIPRKRIDRLLEIVAALRARDPRVRLLKAGGSFTPAQEALAQSLGLADAIVQVPFLTTAQLGALYRHAAVVLATSSREGFGLPVAEALACGTSVVATDLPVFREVGGAAAAYAPLADTSAWCAAVWNTLDGSASPEHKAATRARNVASASRFSWRAYAAAMTALYDTVAAGARATSAQVVA